MNNIIIITLTNKWSHNTNNINTTNNNNNTNRISKQQQTSIPNKYLTNNNVTTTISRSAGYVTVRGDARSQAYGAWRGDAMRYIDEYVTTHDGTTRVMRR